VFPRLFALFHVYLKEEYPKMKRSSLFWGAVLLLVGILLLLDNLNFLPIRVWDLLWPALLVLVGVWILIGTLTSRRYLEDEHVVIPLDGAASANVRINHGAGRIRLGAGGNPNDLAEGDFGGGLDLRTHRQGEALEVEMSVPSRNFSMGPWGWNREGMNWNFVLNRDIPMRLEVKTGANEADLDLTDLLVSDLKLYTGASSTRLALPASAGQTQVHIEAGAAAVYIRVPENVSARIRSQGGLSSTSVNSARFPRRDGGIYQSADYETAQNRVDVNIQSGVGSVDIR
jgi:hypothetical protein